MKKDRNTFFSNYNQQTQSYFPDINTFQPNQSFGPYQSANASSSFYSGPDIQNWNEVDNRLSKIERQLNRLDSRLSKLESNHLNNNIPSNDNNYSNMYMI